MKRQEVLKLIRSAGRTATSLDLSGKGLTEVPDEICELRGLLRLSLRANKLHSLPAEFANLVSLTSLDLDFNSFRVLPRELGGLVNLERLTLKGNALATLPPSIANLSNLRVLHLKGNKLTSLPEEIGQLTHLRGLFVSDNELAVLPREIGLLAKLEALTLFNNRLATLPAEIGNNTNLQKLDLSYNQLTVLPAEIGSLTKLIELRIDRNELTSLPAQIGDLGQLITLGIEHNLLAEVPSEIGRLKNLRAFHAEGNPIKALPPEMGNLRNLKYLLLDKRNLLSPPPEIVEQGREAILIYLRERVEGSSRQWLSKLLIVGEGGVGKTSLVRALRGEAFQFAESTTHGIDIQTLQLEHPHKEEVMMQLNSWDFGGQEIYHATHQFFLTNRSLFILVWNARLGFEQGRLYYWLDTIKARAPESPVLLVATYVDERDANIPISELQQRYPQIIGHFETSNKTGFGISKLRGALAEAAASLPLMGEDWPTNWLNAARAVRAKSKEVDFITPNQLDKIMTENQVSRERITVLSQWLHELGDILYFREDPELNDTLILNPQWVTQSISRVLESEEVIQRLGLFTRSHMDEIWSDIEPAMRDHFLRLMERFDLSYRTLENKDISLVVERLNLDPPDYGEVWNERKETEFCNEVSLKYVLDTTMPAGIPTWFIARSHRFTTRTHWRYGALFTDGPERKHLALIQAFPHDRYLKLTVRGPIPQNFFALLSDGLELTLRRFPGMRVERKIPCPGHNGQPCTHEFDLVHLQKAIGRRPPLPEIQCPVSFEDVSVSGLLFGIHWDTENVVLEQIELLDRASADRHRKLFSEIQKVKYDIEDLREFAQREFTNQFHREQEEVESHCPGVFILQPVIVGNRLVAFLRRKAVGERIKLHLFCQAPGNWHPTEEGGVYMIEKPAKWLQTMAPYLRAVVRIIKYAGPLLGPTATIALPDAQMKALETHIKFTEQLIKKLPDSEDDGVADIIDDITETTEPSKTFGAELRQLRLLLDLKDPRQHWGGLKKVLTPEGHYFWLCQRHSAHYS